MVQIREAEVSCLHLFAAFVHVHVVLDVLEPLERLSKEHVFLNEDTTVLVKDMEDKKGKYNTTLEQLEAKNQLFIDSLETLNKEHQTLIDFTADTVK